MKGDASAALRRAVTLNILDFGGVPIIEETVSRNWASVTFAGERHEMRLRLDGDGAGAAADAFLDGLADREFDLRRHILIDIACVGDSRTPDGVTLALEGLTVEAD